MPDSRVTGGLWMSEHPILQVAVVGSGPSGFYAAAALAGSQTPCRIDIFERLPSPYGLIRAGVAPDHQTTKSIQDVFGETARHPAVRFIGNVEIGRDISLADLRGAYDAVVLASGVPEDAPLGIAGADLPGVHGAAAFVGWYNGHPDFSGLAPDLAGRSAVILGNGNVALDVARILSRTEEELAASDIADHAAEALARSGLMHINVMGRRGPGEAKFTNVELQEIGTLQGATALADARQIPEDLPDGLPPRDRRMRAKNLDCFRRFAQSDPGAPGRRIRFGFFARPIAILGTGRVEAVRFARAEQDPLFGSAPDEFDIPADIVIASIGYRARPFSGLPLAEGERALANDDGRIEDGLYVVGWLKRGPSGKIATNRLDGDAIAERIVAECTASGAPGFSALAERLADKGVRASNFDHWLRMDAAEIAAARGPAPRRKFTTIADMLRAGGVA